MGGYIGQRIVARGSYNQSERTLIVEETADMEVLPTQPVVISTVEYEPTNTPTPTVIPQETVEATPEVQI